MTMFIAFKYWVDKNLLFLSLRNTVLLGPGLMVSGIDHTFTFYSNKFTF